MEMYYMPLVHTWRLLASPSLLAAEGTSSDISQAREVTSPWFLQIKVSSTMKNLWIRGDCFRRSIHETYLQKVYRCRRLVVACRDLTVILLVKLKRLGKERYIDLRLYSVLR